MSEDTPKSTPLDLSSLRLMPDWVANFGQDHKQRRHDDEGDESSARPRRDDRRPGGGRGTGGGPGFQNRGERRDRGDRRDGPRGQGQGQRPGFGRDRGGQGRDRFQPRDEPPPIPSGVKVTIEPEERSLDALTQHVRTQGRAFSLFDAARLVLAGVERHQVRFDCEAERLVGLFKVAADGALFETREEALSYVLKHPEALATYYQAETIELEEPKGNFTSVAVCGLSGALLAPPSHHSYQAALKRLHVERFSNMAFEDYKRRVQVKADAELVQKWKDEQRKGTRWTWLQSPQGEDATPVTFQTQAEVESHFRRTHGDSAVSEVRSHVMPGSVRREQLSPGLGRLFRRVLEDTRKHLFDLSQRIAHGLEKRGLKLFKRRSGKLFVSRVKPRAIDPAVVFSDRVNQIVEVIRKEPGIQAAKLLEILAPSPAPVAEGEAAKEPAEKVLTEEQKAAIRDLRWLADEGYVIEYSDGPVFLGIQGDPPNAKPTTAKANPSTTAEAAVTEEQAEETAPEVEAEALVEAEIEAEVIETEPEAAPAEPEATAESESEEPSAPTA